MRKVVTSTGALALALLTSGLISGCPTTFTGNAHVADGKAGCERKCKESGLRFSALVYLGEYSSACVCEPKSAPPAPVASESAVPPAAAPAAPPPAVTLPPATNLPTAPPPAAPAPPGPTSNSSGGARPAALAAVAGSSVAVMTQQIRDQEAYTSFTLVD